MAHTTTYISLDTETGGLFPEDNPLLQVGFGIYRLDHELLTHETLAEIEFILKPSQFPGQKIEEQALSSNHLVPVELEKDGLSVEEGSDVLLSAIMQFKPVTILGQNLPFDLRFLATYLTPEVNAEIGKLRRKDLLDVTLDYNFVSWDDEANYPSRSLGKVAPRLGVTNEDAHRALSDAKTTFLCMVAMFRQFRKVNRILQLVKCSKLTFNQLNSLSKEIV